MSMIERSSLIASALRPLERVAADDRAEPAALADRPDLVEHLARRPSWRRRRRSRSSSRRRADWTTCRTRSASVAIGIFCLLVHLSRRVLLDVRGGELHLDDVGAELGGDLRGVGRDVDRRLALLREREPRGYDQTTTASPAAFASSASSRSCSYMSPARRGAGVDRVADRAAARVAARPRRSRSAPRSGPVSSMSDLVVVELQDQRNLAGVVARRPPRGSPSGAAYALHPDSIASSKW